MSVTDLGFAVYHGQKRLSEGYANEYKAIRAAYRIAKTEGYTYEYKGFLDGRWHKSKLAPNWKRLRIRRAVDWGGAVSSHNVRTISREEAERTKAKPYEEASNVKHLRRPKELRATFCRSGEIFKFKEAYIERGHGLAIIYEGQLTAEEKKRRDEEFLKATPPALQELMRETGGEPLKVTYYIDNAEQADKWKEASLSAEVYKSIEAKASGKNKARRSSGKQKEKKRMVKGTFQKAINEIYEASERIKEALEMLAPIEIWPKHLGLKRLEVIQKDIEKTADKMQRMENAAKEEEEAEAEMRKALEEGNIDKALDILFEPKGKTKA